MSTTQILDAIAPYTAADSRCGRMKKRKVEYRYQLLLEIEEMQKVMTNEDILSKLLYDTGRTIHNFLEAS